MNSFTVQGRFGKDPELKRNKNDKSYVSFSIAEKQKVMKQGKWEEETYWWNCMAWGKMADTLCKFFVKGKPIIVTGKLRQWESEGVTRVSMDVNDWTFVERDSTTNADRPAAGGDDDIPFSVPGDDLDFS